MKFEWDHEKEEKNIKNHGIAFKTAVRVFQDANRVEEYDESHSLYEDRYITIGRVGGTFMIVQVAYTQRGEVARIISARHATKREREAYYDSNNNP